MTSVALTIGTFDGVHTGHRALVRRARELADASSRGTVVAFVFDPHPAATLRPDAAPARLSTFEQRAAWLKQAGADRVERLTPTPEFLSQPPELFIRSLVDRFKPSAIVEGLDFRFGRGRQGSVLMLDDLGATLGFRAEILQPVQVALTDHTMVTASSTIIRWLVSHGRMRDTSIVLGRPYAIRGQVNRGDQRGRQLGFPTANINTECLIPADGVYAGVATLPSGNSYAAAIHVGPRATFGDTRRTIEAHLLDVPTTPDPAATPPTKRIESLPEYGWPIELSFDEWLRDQMKFESVDRLVAQMTIDCARARELVNHRITSNRLQETRA